MPIQKLSLRVRRYQLLQTSSAVRWPFPVHPQIRIAQLEEDAPAFGFRKAYSPGSATDLEGFQPNIVTGSAAGLQRLAEQKQLGSVSLASLDHAVVVVTRCGQPPLTDVSRVVFWQTFGVPVYEVLAGFDNGILGYECELHEGWHLGGRVQLTNERGELVLDADGVAGLRTGISGFVTDDECPCGRQGRRLLDIRPVEEGRLKSLLNWSAIA